MSENRPEWLRRAMRSEEEELLALQAELQTELARPDAEQDAARVEELTQLICAMTNLDERIPTYREACCTEIRRRQISMKRSAKHGWARRIAAVCACVAVVVVANICSMAAFGTNIFTATVQWLPGSFGITMPSWKEPITPADENDIYGMKAECEKYGFTPLTPAYIPEGFELTLVNPIVSNQKESYVQFIYTKDRLIGEDVLLNIMYRHYNNAEDILPSGIPSDDTPPKEEVINGVTMWTLEEDDQFHVMFSYENTVYHICSRRLGGDECRKVAASFVAE